MPLIGFGPLMGCTDRKRPIPTTQQALRNGVGKSPWWTRMSPAASVVEVTAMKPRRYNGQTCVTLGQVPEYDLNRILIVCCHLLDEVTWTNKKNETCRTQLQTAVVLLVPYHGWVMF